MLGKYLKHLQQTVYQRDTLRKACNSAYCHFCPETLSPLGERFKICLQVIHMDNDKNKYDNDDNKYRCLNKFVDTE